MAMNTNISTGANTAVQLSNDEPRPCLAFSNHDAPLYSCSLFVAGPTPRLASTIFAIDEKRETGNFPAGFPDLCSAVRNVSAFIRYTRHSSALCASDGKNVLVCCLCRFICSTYEL